jgi:pyruvate dehydrogenase E1 component alpha subunit
VIRDVSQLAARCGSVTVLDVKRRLSSDHGVSDDDIKAVDARIRKIVTEAADFAQNDPLPDVSELWTDVYVEA